MIRFLSLLVLPAAFAAAAPVDRQAVVSRHDVTVTKIDPQSPLSVGNGDFAFTVDVTGLQSLEPFYHDHGIPTETLSTWAWHSFPNVQNLRLADAMKVYDFHGREIPYPALQSSPAGEYFRQNPHPIPLGQIGLIYQGRPIDPATLGAIHQRLDLWTGAITSRYTLHGQPVTVTTVADSERSAVAVKIESPLLARGDLAVRFRFAYAYDFKAKNRPALIWDRPEAHETRLHVDSGQAVTLTRTLDASHYVVGVRWEGGAAMREAAPHDFRLEPKGSGPLSFVAAFTPEVDPALPPTFSEVFASSERGWRDYWMKGGMVDLAGSSDPRAAELERRIVLSQYLVRVNYAGSFPPAEAGLTFPTWFGKHNSEMFFWHAAQFYQWGHPELLEKGLAWYRKILPAAVAVAHGEGFEGAHWPKMAGIDGRPSPGTINPFIIWNQPNPIYLSELVYRAHPDRATLEKYRDVVFESAKFLASYAFLDPTTGHYVLGPPIRSVNEQNGENNTRDPSFELAYWYYGLQVAQEWRRRLGLKPDPHWADVMSRLTPLTVTDGLYADIETFPDEFKKPGEVSSSMLMADGFLPRTPMVDPAIMRRTLDAICAKNGMDYWVSWAMGKAAMTAARLDEPELSVTILANDKTPAARFLNNGHIPRAKEPTTCPAYLPTNAALLCAAGLMTAGWEGAPKRNAPGFPADGKWTVKWEGLHPMP
jgi:hypothetical protein